MPTVEAPRRSVPPRRRLHSLRGRRYRPVPEEAHAPGARRAPRPRPAAGRSPISRVGARAIPPRPGAARPRPRSARLRAPPAPGRRRSPRPRPAPGAPAGPAPPERSAAAPVAPRRLAPARPVARRPSAHARARGGDEITQRGQLARAQAQHRAQPLGSLEAAPPLSFLDDAACEPRAHAGQPGQLLRRGLVEIEWARVGRRRLLLRRASEWRAFGRGPVDRARSAAAGTVGTRADRARGSAGPAP